MKCTPLIYFIFILMYEVILDFVLVTGFGVGFFRGGGVNLIP